MRSENPPLFQAHEKILKSLLKIVIDVEIYYRSDDTILSWIMLMEKDAECKEKELPLCTLKFEAGEELALSHVDQKERP